MALRIGIDLDGVLADMESELVRQSEILFGEPMTRRLEERAADSAPTAEAAAAAPGAPQTVGGAVVEYEPGEEAILADLLPRNIKIQIFKGLLENVAGEQGASMTAMDNATRNAGDLVKKLTIEYNRTRQAAITKELIEIISGAEAL